MYRGIRVIAYTSFLAILITVVAFSQELIQYKVPIVISVSSVPGRVDTLWLGVHGDGPNPPGTVIDNTYGPDIDGNVYGEWKEYFLPPDPQEFDFIAKFIQIPGRTALPPEGIAASGMKPNDFRGFTSPGQVDTFAINVYGDGVNSYVGAGVITLSWPANLHSYKFTWELKKRLGASYSTVVADMGSPIVTTWTDDNTSGANNVRYLIISSSSGPLNPGCAPSPTNFAFGNVSSNVTTKSLIISNPNWGTFLSISSITTPEGFSITPSAPITVSWLKPDTFYVTFDATGKAGGTFSGNIVLTHNGAPTGTATTTIPVSATILEPGIASATIDFGVIPYPQTRTQNFTLTNTSSLRPLSVLSITSTNPFFSATPTVPPPFIIAAGGSANLTITFTTPLSNGLQSGFIIITTDSPSSPDTLYVSGNSLCQCSSLSFTAPTLSVLDNSYANSGYYTENINLSNYSGVPLKALQLTLVSRGKVIMHKLEKAPAVANWQLSTNVMRGQILPDGSSIDSINVVLWALGSDVFLPTSGTVPLLTFGYDVVNITKDQDTTSFELLKILGSTSAFSDAMLNTNSTETIIINNRIQRGDVNNDDRVDILDLLAIVDHITGKAILTGDAFTAADVAPWPTGDGSVDVRDLAQVQSIILNNQYPDGNPLLQVPIKTLASGELQKTAAAKLIIHVDPKGKELGFEIEGMGVRGLQVDMLNIQAGGNATDELVGPASLLDGNTLRVVIKSTEAFPVQSIIARIPATFRAADVQYANLMVVGEDLKAMNYEASIVYDIARDPSLPDAYSLEQNYPNPFNPSTKITYAIKEQNQVRIAVYNILGQEVAVLVNQEKAAGRYTIDWNGTGSTGNLLSTGIYIYRMTAGNFVETRKMLFLK